MSINAPEIRALFTDPTDADETVFVVKFDEGGLYVVADGINAGAEVANLVADLADTDSKIVSASVRTHKGEKYLFLVTA